MVKSMAKKTIKGQISKANKKGVVSILPSRKTELLGLAQDKKVSELNGYQFECTETGVTFEYQVTLTKVVEKEAKSKDNNLAPISL